MEEASSLPVSDPANPGKSRRRQQFSILIACVLIATALWFLRALENEYTTRIDHPVRYINEPDKMMTMNPLPQRISLEVKGLGFSILRHNWNFSKTPITIDLRQIRPTPARRRTGFVEYLPMNLFINDFSSQLKDLRVTGIIPDTMMFRFAVKKTKLVRVIANFNYEKDSSRITDSLILIRPDSIEVEGPDLVLDTLQYIHTLPIKIGRQGQKFSRSIELEDLHKLVKTKPATVTVSIGTNK